MLHLRGISVVLLPLALLATPHLQAVSGPSPVFDVVADEVVASPGEGERGSRHELLLAVDQGLLQSNPEAIAVALPDGGSAVARRIDWQTPASGEFHWFGELDDAPNATRSGLIGFHYYQERLIGTLRTAGGAFYRLVPEEAGLHRLVRVESARGGCGIRPAAGGPQVPAEGLETIASAVVGPSDTECLTAKVQRLIDVMVLYPLTLRPQAQAVQDFAVEKIAEANMIFDMSDVYIDYRLTYIGPITGEQPPGPASSGGNEATAPVLAWLNDQFATVLPDHEVELLRLAYGADLIAVVVPPHPNNNCGLANLPELRNGVESMYASTVPFGNKAFVAVELDCGEGDFTLAHELGHTFGMRHEDDRLPTTGTRQAIYPWAYGYDIVLPGDDVATLMACFAPPSNCRRILHLSNPDVDYQENVPTGLHSSQSSEPAHNACVANKRAAQYASFAAPRPTSPPTLVITSPEDGAQVTAGVSFNLVAVAMDPEDGNRNAYVQWSSDRDGFLGSGSPLAVALSAGGSHLITATVTDTSGTKVPYSIRLTAYETNPPLLSIGHPTNNEQIYGTYRVFGWATDSSGVTSISFKVDGAPVTLSDLTYGTTRADVCAAYPSLNDPNCPQVGYQGDLNTEQFSNGYHTLQLTAVDAFGNTAILNRSFLKVSALILEPTDDAYVSEAQPNSNFGTEQTLKLRASGSGQALHTYLKFNVVGLTRRVISAKLQLQTLSTPLSGLRVYWMQSSSWSQSSITWNNASLAYYLNYPTSSHPASSPIEIDVRTIVGGNGVYTIGLVSPDEPNQAVYSTESLYLGPKLVITY